MIIHNKVHLSETACLLIVNRLQVLSHEIDCDFNRDKWKGLLICDPAVIKLEILDEKEWAKCTWEKEAPTFIKFWATDEFEYPWAEICPETNDMYVVLPRADFDLLNLIIERV